MGAMDVSHNLSRTTAIAYTLSSALLFGLAMPALKPLMQAIEPQLAAGLLYMAMGLGLGATYLARGAPSPRIVRGEMGWLLLTLVSGGAIAPWLLFWGLAHATATTTSLLANTEIVFSTVLARFLFGEGYSGRLFFGVALILGGAMTLGGIGIGAIAPGPALAIVAACGFWGIDNNAMRKIAHGDASFVGCMKGLFAGAMNLGLALAFGATLPALSTTLGIAAVGAICYGASFGLYVRGLRVLGAARTSAYYGVAPFAGAAVAITFLHEPVTLRLAAAALLMGLGVGLHLIEPHAPMGPHAVDVPDDPDKL